MLRGEDGQAVVEAAIVLPAMVFLLLLALQLTQLQQARVLAEYAAFAAARAGIVMDGDPARMKQAATLAVLSGSGQFDGVSAIARTFLRLQAEDAVLRPFGLEQVRVYVHNPVAPDFARWGRHLDGQEIDFDDVRPGATEATLLSLQIRWLYELKVPFANRMIQAIWVAAKSGLLQSWRGWDLTGPRLGSQTGPDAIATSHALAAGIAVPDGTPEGIPIAALAAAARAGRYYLPVQAFYTMRMQSNPYRKWAHP
jgi:TadE-like protein